jgi:hypothetical protein
MREPFAASLEPLTAVLRAARGQPTDTRQEAIDQLDRWLARGYVPPAPPEAEGQLIAAAGWMLDVRPDHPVIPVWVARAPQVLRELEDQPLAAQLANFVFDHSIRIGNFGEAGRLVAEMWERTASSRSARLTWLPSAALYLRLSGRPDAALAALRPALEDDSLVPATRFALLEQAANATLALADHARCLAYLVTAEPLSERLLPRDRAQIAFLRAGTAVWSGDVDGAQQAIRSCEERAESVDAAYFHAVWRLGAAVVAVQGGSERRAERELSELLGDVVLMRARYLEWSVRLARAAARLGLDRRAAAEADLLSGLRIAAEHGYVNCDPWSFSPHLGALLELALERSIEVRTVRAILAHRPA